MKFDEANKIVKSFDEDPELEYWMPNSKVYEIIEGLREEYAPTVEMTKFEKDNLLKYVFGDEGNFFDLVEYETDYLYRKLSTSELMQAWLHPETIKVVDK